jgi:hypothetical protein
MAQSSTVVKRATQTIPLQRLPQVVTIRAMFLEVSPGDAEPARLADGELTSGGGKTCPT